MFAALGQFVCRKFGCDPAATVAGAAALSLFFFGPVAGSLMVTAVITPGQHRKVVWVNAGMMLALVVPLALAALSFDRLADAAAITLLPIAFVAGRFVRRQKRLGVNADRRVTVGMFIGVIVGTACALLATRLV